MNAQLCRLFGRHQCEPMKSKYPCCYGGPMKTAEGGGGSRKWALRLKLFRCMFTLSSDHCISKTANSYAHSMHFVSEHCICVPAEWPNDDFELVSANLRRRLDSGSNFNTWGSGTYPPPLQLVQTTPRSRKIEVPMGGIAWAGVGLCMSRRCLLHGISLLLMTSEWLKTRQTATNERKPKVHLILL